jgi:hypothetical protein
LLILECFQKLFSTSSTKGSGSCLWFFFVSKTKQTNENPRIYFILIQDKWRVPLLEHFRNDSFCDSNQSQQKDFQSFSQLMLGRWI